MRVEKGGFAEKELDKSLSPTLVSAKDRSLATELVYGVLRWRRRLDYAIDRYLTAPSRKIAPKLRQILRLAVYQHLFLSKIPPHALVYEAVNQARIECNQRAASFVNAILRALLANESAHAKPQLRDAADLARWYSHPQWLVQRWIDQFGTDAAERMLAANNVPAALMCRCNGLKTTLRDLFASLAKDDLEGEPSFLGGAFQLHTHGRSLRETSSYKSGLFSVQDMASQIIPCLVQAKAGMRVLDACAAPGGKTAHIADICQNKVFITAVDASDRRLAEAQKNLRRLGVKNVRYRVGDVRDRDFAASLGRFDRILVDAPCSGLGVLRRNPEARYRVAEEDLPAFAAKQKQITRSLAPLLKPGGKMVYSVCTVTREETREVVSAVLGDCSNLHIDRIRESELDDMGWAVTEDGCVETFPAQKDMLVDGFFAVRFSAREKCE